MAPGTNLADYVTDDLLPDVLEVDDHIYQYGKSLAKDARTLTTMMRTLHDWYMETCRDSGGQDTLMLKVTEEHDLVGIDLLSITFEEFFHIFNQRALDKPSVTSYCL